MVPAAQDVAMNLIALPIAHTATRRAVRGALADDSTFPNAHGRGPAPRTRRR
jgi:hypothetical protein